jgi:AcrR family transcriptional regulator
MLPFWLLGAGSGRPDHTTERAPAHSHQSMEIRDRLLQATLRVFSETGYRGATTRRIAQQAGANEVTLFRQFGSKDQLIREALQSAGNFGEQPHLPDHPKDAQAELEYFCLAQSRQFRKGRALIRKVLGEIEEHPDMVPYVTQHPVECRGILLDYLDKLRASGAARPDFDASAAAAMLIGAIFADAMTHEVVPPANGASSEALVRGFVELFLRSIGVEQSALTN